MLEWTANCVDSANCKNREIMRDHCLACLMPLRPHQINDVCFIDAFFSALHLMQGFTAFQLHTFKESQCECMSLMKFKSQIPQSLLDLSGDVGAPTVLVKDGAKEMMGADWL